MRELPEGSVELLIKSFEEVGQWRKRGKEYNNRVTDITIYMTSMLLREYLYVMFPGLPLYIIEKKEEPKLYNKFFLLTEKMRGDEEEKLEKRKKERDKNLKKKEEDFVKTLKNLYGEV